ncbi:MAG: type IV pilus assembly protein PilM [Candidatus Omnitrophica bacterium]|nr:type IV pilus assembly protein PilM [Candidatus Omnitrophota bacterium]
MFWNRPRKYIGIDISESGVKVAEILKFKDDVRLIGFKILDLERERPEEEADFLNKRTGELLEKVNESIKIKGGRLALSIAGYSVFIRLIKFPHVAKSKISQIVKYEAQQQVPFPIDEVIWDYHVTGSVGSELEAILVAVKNEIVSTAVSRLLGYDPDIASVTASPLALCDALSAKDDLNDRLILDLGAKATDMIIVHDGKIWSRSIMIGADELTSAIANQSQVSFKEAESIKRNDAIALAETGPSNLPPEKESVARAMVPVLTDMSTEISQSITFYNTHHNKIDLKEVIITGGGASLKGIDGYLESHLGLKVRRADPTNGLLVSKELNLGEPALTRLGTAIGLALSLAKPPEIRINLISPEQKMSDIFRMGRRAIFTSLIFVILILSTITATSNQKNRSKFIELGNLKAFNEDYEQNKIRIDKLRSENSITKERLEAAIEISKKNPLWFEVFAKLKDALGDEIWITEIETKPRGDKYHLLIKGRTKGPFPAISAFKNSLNLYGVFVNVKIISADLIGTHSVSGGIGPADEGLKEFVIEADIRT